MGRKVINFCEKKEKKEFYSNNYKKIFDIRSIS